MGRRLLIVVNARSKWIDVIPMTKAAAGANYQEETEDKEKQECIVRPHAGCCITTEEEHSS